jgi:hypothetical protein
VTELDVIVDQVGPDRGVEYLLTVDGCLDGKGERVRAGSGSPSVCGCVLQRRRPAAWLHGPFALPARLALLLRSFAATADGLAYAAGLRCRRAVPASPPLP